MTPLGALGEGAGSGGPPGEAAQDDCDIPPPGTTQNARRGHRPEAASAEDVNGAILRNLTQPIGQERYMNMSCIGHAAVGFQFFRAPHVQDPGAECIEALDAAHVDGASALPVRPAHEIASETIKLTAIGRRPLARRGQRDAAILAPGLAQEGAAYRLLSREAWHEFEGPLVALTLSYT